MKSPTAGLRRATLNIPGNSMIAISRITAVNEGILKDLNALLPQLSTSAKPLTMEFLNVIINNPANFLYVARDGERM